MLADPAGLNGLVEATVAPFADAGSPRWPGSRRGFILASPAASRLGAGFVPLRKPGKLPWKVVREEYSLEYGTDALEVHQARSPPTTGFWWSTTSSPPAPPGLR